MHPAPKEKGPHEAAPVTPPHPSLAALPLQNRPDATRGDKGRWHDGIWHSSVSYTAVHSDRYPGSRCGEVGEPAAAGLSVP